MKKDPGQLTIAVDGYSSCGKSTFAKKIAKKLNYLYIDSGAMYRAVTLLAIEKGAIENGRVNEKQLQSALRNINIGFVKHNDEYLIQLNGRIIEKEIRGNEVSSNVSGVSKFEFVRKIMVELQRNMSKGKGVVMDGRDIGTVVFPDADIKIFMTADEEVRAQRRYDELKEKGYEPDYKEVLKNISERDRIDENRDISPLRKANDAYLLDNSHMTLEQQMIWFNELLERIIK